MKALSKKIVKPQSNIIMKRKETETVAFGYK